MKRIEAFEASLHGSRRVQGLLLRRYGIAPTAANLAVLSRYATRVRRARWWGVVGVVIAAGIWWFGTSEDAAGLSLARFFAGYLIGSGLAEFAPPALKPSGPTHVASLSPRAPASLLPRWARVLPWLFLVPCLAAPLLLMGDHPVGVTRFRHGTGSVRDTATWFAPSVLVGTAVVAIASLIVWQLTLHALAARPLPLDPTGAAQVDLLTRALSARAVSGTAAALGLSLLGGLGYLSFGPLTSSVCTSVSGCHYVYAAHDRYVLFQGVSGLLILSAILLFWFSRLPRIDKNWLRALASS